MSCPKSGRKTNMSCQGKYMQHTCFYTSIPKKHDDRYTTMSSFTTHPPNCMPPKKTNMSLIHLLLYRYRFCKGTRGCLMSIFKIHNETMNIWSHLLGFVFFAILTCLTFVSFNVSGSMIYKWIHSSIDIMRCLVYV